MPTTVELLKASAVAQIQADLTAAVAASASSASTSANAAAASAAAAALIAAGLVYNGVVDGNAVPATMTAAGYFRVITTAGTSQGITWAPLDLAIYKGTSGQYDKVQYASVTGSYVDPIAASRSAGWPSYFFDGVTTGQRVFWALGAAGNVGASDFTVVVPARSLARRSGSITAGLFYIGAVNTSYGTGSFTCYLRSDGSLRLQLGQDAHSRIIDVSAAAFFNLYQGRTGDIVLRKTSSGITLDWLEGRTVNAITLPPETTNGSPPAWGDALDAQFLVLGTAFSGAHYSGELGAPEFINRAWSASDLTYWSRHRRLPAKDRATGNQQPLADPTLASDLSSIWTDPYNKFVVGGGTITGTSTAQYNYLGALTTGGNRMMAAGQTVRYSITVTAVTGSWVLQQGANGTFLALFSAPGTYTGTYTASANDSAAVAWALKQIGTGTGAITVSAISLVYEGALIQPEVTRVAQLLDHGLNRICGVMTNGVVPLSDRDSLPIRGSVSATGFALGLGANDPVWYEPGLITSLRIKQATASAQTITLRLNTSGGTTIATATTAASTDWQTIALSIPGGFEVNAGDRLHWTITNSINWDLTWSRR